MKTETKQEYMCCGDTYSLNYQGRCNVCGSDLSEDKIVQIEVYSHDCLKCGKTFTSYEEDPEICRNCKREDWKKPISETDYFLCPVCNEKYLGSSFLAKSIPEEKTRFIANLITHYRHVHRNWDKQYQYISRYHDYDRAKIDVNNQIKRKLLKSLKAYWIEKEYTKENFLALMDNDEKTIELINMTFK